MTFTFRVCATIFLFSNIVHYIHCFQFPQPYPQNSCDGAVQNVDPRESFIKILSIIQAPLFPQGLVYLKEKISNLISQNQLNVEPIVQFLATLDHLDEFSLMMAALLALRDTLPPGCAIRDDIAQIIINSNSASSKVRTVDNVVAPGTEHLSCDSIQRIIDYYGYFYHKSQCNRYRSHILNIFNGRGNNWNQNDQRRSVESSSYLNIPTAQHKMTWSHNFMKILPTPQNKMDQNYYDIINLFFKSSEFEKFYKEFPIADSTTITPTIFKLISEKILSSSTISKNIKDAFYYYLYYDSYDYSTLIALLPQPTNEEEENYYRFVKLVLMNKANYHYLRQIDASSYSDTKLLLKDVLAALGKIGFFDDTIKQAIHFYRNYRPSFDYSTLVQLLPQPIDEEERNYYEHVKNFLMNKANYQYLSQINALSYSDQKLLLTDVLFALSKANFINAVTKDAMHYYITSRAHFDYSTLVPLLPQPIDNEEEEFYGIITTLLTNKANYKYLRSINALSYSNQKLLLKEVLSTLSRIDIFDAVTKQAIDYYLNDQMINLELYTRKEIKKRFELTKIFQDTIQIQNLGNEGQIALKRFFKFCSKLSSEDLADFENWTEVKTRGEFMHVLFHYFLNKPLVSPDIKQAILILEPEVLMNGSGALPP